MCRNQDNAEDYSEKIRSLWTKFRSNESKHYSSAEIEFAETLAATPNAFEQFIGRAALMDARSPNLESLISLIEDECAKGFERAKFYAPNVLWLQFGFPSDVLLRPSIRSFIIAAARSDKPSCRVNATHLLVKVASTDEDAMSILMQLKDDPDESVRENARVVLKQNSLSET